MLKLVSAILIFLSIFTNNIFAKDFSKIVENFLSYNGVKKSIISKDDLIYNGKVVANVYNLSNGGYVIVPNSKNFSPIKAFSFRNDFKNLPKAYRDFIAYELAQMVLTRSIDSEVLKRWDFLENYTPSKYKSRVYQPNTYILKTTWNQDMPYNLFYNKIDGKLPPVGCVQVAEAQLMKYHAYPSKAKGTFASKNGLTAYLNRYYNWDIMPNSLKDDNVKDYQKEEVALLMRDLGAINNAKIALDGTSASPNIEILVNNFKYSKNIKHTSTEDISKSEFIQIIKSQIDKELPVLLSLPGHMVVADGYKNDNSGKYIHINMGWGGIENNFYNMDETIYTKQFTFDTNKKLDIFYDIKPCSGDDCVENLESLDKLTSNQIDGYFDFENDIDKYQVYLKGDTNFDKDGGFYINLYNSKHELVKSFDRETTLNLPADLYTIEVSLQSIESGRYFLYSSDYNRYKVTIDTQELSQDEKNSIDTKIKTKPTIALTKDSYVISSEKKILLNVYDEDDDDFTIEAFSNNNAVVEVSLNRNILTLKPKVEEGVATIRVKVTSGSDIVTKDIEVVVMKNPIGYGKEFKIRGKFDSQDDFNKHKVLLEGECTIEGFNGYRNQAFYTSLMDEDGNVLNTMNDETIHTSNLSKGIYYIGASLKQNPKGSGKYYSYKEDHANYTLTITCPNSTVTIDDLKEYVGNTNTPQKTFPTIKSFTASVEENATVGTKLGIVEVVDDGGDSITAFHLIGEGKETFAISKNGEVTLAKTLDYETKNFYSLKVYATNSVGDSKQEDFNVTVIDIDENINENNDTNESNTTETIDNNESNSSEQNQTEQNQSVINLQEGWNLISLPISQKIEIENFIADFSTKPILIWSFDDNGWYFYTESELLNQALKALSLSTIDEIDSNKGYWVYEKQDANLTYQKGKVEEIDYTSLSKGWNLLGSHDIKEPRKLLQDNGLKIMWKFDGKDWYGVSSKDSVNTKIEQKYKLLEYIKETEGFWLLK